MLKEDGSTFIEQIESDRRGSVQIQSPMLTDGGTNSYENDKFHMQVHYKKKCLLVPYAF